MKYSNEWVIAQWNNNKVPGFVFFWRPGTTHEKVSASCFSQWHETPFVVDGVTYHTAEHWMMAGKARLFADQEIFDAIINTLSPATVQNLGRKVKRFDPATWDAEKFDIVAEGNLHKFSQHPSLKEFLLNTGDQVLVEASPYDRIWGIGLAEGDPRVKKPADWNGQNLLGFALMEVRDKLRKHEND